MRGEFWRQFTSSPCWHISLSDESCDLPECLGLVEIHSALEEGCSEEDLLSFEGGDQADTLGEIYDSRAVREIQRRAGDVDKEQRQAVDRRESDRLGLERIRLREAMNESLYRGRPKSFRTALDREIDARRKNVTRALATISKSCPGIAEHLRATLKSDGAHFHYTGELDWILECEASRTVDRAIRKNIALGIRVNALFDYLEHGEDDRPDNREDRRDFWKGYGQFDDFCVRRATKYKGSE
jgi:hypothetical protein